MKKAIVIGASSGIGEGIARELARNGYKVGITGRRKELLENLKSESPDNYIIRSFDNTEYESALSELKSLTGELGGLDLLILSSGMGKRNQDLNYEFEKLTVDLNVSAFTNIVVWAYNFFKNSGGGHLMIISSVAGMRGNRFAPAYSATKSFQMKYAEGLIQRARKEKCDIYITDIRPGYVDTEMGNGPGSFWRASVEKSCRQIYQRGIIRKREVIYVTRRWRYVALLFRLVPSFIYKRL